MITREIYYEIVRISQEKWRATQGFAAHREQLDDDAFLSAKHSVLVGEKGVGKTVLACQKAQIYQREVKRDIIYASLDDTFFSSFTMFEIAQAAQAYGAALVVFDEVHRYPAWKEDLKQICDRLEIRTIVSGSSILSFAELGGLARRIVKYTLVGLTFREYLNLRYHTAIRKFGIGDIVENNMSIASELREEIEQKADMKLIAVYEQYLQQGYYAYALNEPLLSNFLKMLRQATEDTIAYEIVLAQAHVRTDMSRKLQMLFKAISQNVPYTVDYTALREYAHITDIRTLKHYLACLEQVGVIRIVEKKGLKGLRKADKLYLGNTSLYYAYADLKPDIGSLRETFFLNCLYLAGLQVLSHSGQADFLAGGYVFEIGGPGKKKGQIKGDKKAFIVKDNLEVSSDPDIIPLWLFGMM